MRPVTAQAAALLLLSLACNRAETEEDELQASLGSCGVERWSVKTGTDANVGLVNMTPQDTTIASLRAIAVPASLSWNSPRFTYAGSPEIQTYRLTNVTLTLYKLENDSDYHLVLQDGAGNTMISEIPYSGCISGSAWSSQISSARAAFDARYTASTSFQTANETVTVTGVGFFDLLHGQTGVAPNGIELHPVLGICFGRDCSIVAGDGGVPDAGSPDAGADAGAPDAGAPDAGGPDAGAPDAGAPDAGAPDAGTSLVPAPSGGCSTASPLLPWLLGAVALYTRRRRP
jgi:hypothetical protein